MKQETLIAAWELNHEIDVLKSHINSLAGVIKSCQINIKDKCNTIQAIQIPFEGKVFGVCFAESYNASHFNKQTIRMCKSEIKRISKEIRILEIKFEKLK